MKRRAAAPAVAAELEGLHVVDDQGELEAGDAERWEWAPPLELFLGDEEPSDDDGEDWIVRDLIPRGEPFLIGGAWKGGKTWTALVLAVCVALGRPFLGFENCLARPGRVLVIALEDGRRRLRKRVWQVLRGLGLTPNDATIRANLRVWDRPISIPGDAGELARFSAELQRWRPDLVLVDSLTRAMSGSQNDIRDAAAFTAAWRELGLQTGAAIGFLHHTTKAGGDDKRGTVDAFARMRGSGELLAAPRNLIVMERLGGDDSKVSAVSMRGNLDLQRTSFALEYSQRQDEDGRTIVTLQDRGDVEAVLLAAKDQRKAKTVNEAAQKDERITRTILELARDRGACAAPALAIILGCSDRTAMRQLRDRRERGLVGELGASGSPITSAGLAWLEERAS